MLISQAFAQATGSAPAAGGFGMEQIQQFLPLILIVVVFYFLLLRPQSQKAKRHRELVSNVKRGDRVVTSGGLFGTVNKVIDETKVQIEIAENVRVQVLRTAIADVLAKTDPARVKGAANDADGTGGESASAAPAAPAPTGFAGVVAKFLGKR